ncbi:MAG TPA: alpha/beta fold hydrolase [Candidatus Corynebacterium avicola]|uniref:Alpha/beta fold hydrolase n=1 Tax=Candidatus Corynebacterium avicola TaxID=2838527 RepID=A0A9D1UN65_9CORY|nr:alpha/beta fold hydrolase [Candidatus Corynebacterium avicola]
MAENADTAASSTNSPIVLVHGTAGNRANFEESAPVIKTSGRPVLSVSYGHRGTTDIRWSLEEIVAQLTVLTDRFGSIDLVGHSQGGLLSLAASGILNGEGDGDDLHSRVNHVVGLAADFRGVARPWFCPPESPLFRGFDRALCPAFVDQVVGSEALAEVLPYTAESTVPVTQIITRFDRIVPADRAVAFTAFDELTGIPAHHGPTRVVEVQEQFPDAQFGHAAMPHRPLVGRMVVDALATPPTVLHQDATVAEAKAAVAA